MESQIPPSPPDSEPKLGLFRRRNSSSWSRSRHRRALRANRKRLRQFFLVREGSVRGCGTAPDGSQDWDTVAGVPWKPSWAAGRPRVKGLRSPGLTMPSWRLLAWAGSRVLDRGTGGLGTALGSGNRWVLGRDDRGGLSLHLRSPTVAWPGPG